MPCDGNLFSRTFTADAVPAPDPSVKAFVTPAASRGHRGGATRTLTLAATACARAAPGRTVPRRPRPAGGAPRAADAALLRLLDQYGAAALEMALADALTRGAINAASIAHLLDQRARARHTPPPLAVVLPDDPRVRDLRVTPHRLALRRLAPPASRPGGARWPR